MNRYTVRTACYYDTRPRGTLLHLWQVWDREHGREVPGVRLSADRSALQALARELNRQPAPDPDDVRQQEDARVGAATETPVSECERPF